MIGAILLYMAYSVRLQVVGLSKQAGFLGVAQTSVTRCMMVPASCLLLPPVISAGFKRYWVPNICAILADYLFLCADSVQCPGIRRVHSWLS